jgi:2-oxoisovalerate dehydrogenase E1 component beta subunit
LPQDTCFIDREGSDITLVSWGAMMHDTRMTPEALAEEGISAEVVDVATLKSLEMDTILASVAKTGRCVIIQEAPRAGGWASEIAANLAKQELNYIPDLSRILREVRKVFELAPKA